MIEMPEFLPIGSVVSLKGNEKKLMVIGRALILGEEGSREYYDYAFCLYPEGMLGDAVIYGNHEAISVVHFAGFRDEEDDGVLKQIEDVLAQADVPKSQPQPLNAW